MTESDKRCERKVLHITNNDKKEMQPIGIPASPTIFQPTSNVGKVTQSIQDLEVKLQALKLQHEKLRNDLGLSSIEAGKLSYKKEMKTHINQLKKYNELKDISMSLIQLVADQKNVRIKDILNEIGVEDD